MRDIYNYIHLKKGSFLKGDFFVCFPNSAFQPKKLGFENPAPPPGILGLVGAGNFADLDRAWTAAVGVEILTLFIFSISTEAKPGVVCLRKMKMYFLPKTNGRPLKIDGWKMYFLLK